MRKEKSTGFFPPCLSKLTSLSRVLLLSLFFCFFQTILFAQPAIEWEEAYGGSGYEDLKAIHQTADGGYVMAISTSSNASSDISEPSFGISDYWLVKVDANGVIQWENRLGGNELDNIQEVQPTTDGGYILGGYSRTDINGDKTQANNGFSWTTDFWVVKTDALGNVQWDRSLGGDNNEELYHIQETSDGGYILGGFSLSGATGTKTALSQGGWDFYIVKLDAGGNQLWDQAFGGTQFDMLLDVDEAPDGSFYLGGWSASGATGNKSSTLYGSIDYWVVKIDASGNKLWDQAFGGSGNDQIQSLQVLSDGAILVGGFSDSGISGNKLTPNYGGQDGWLLKISPTGGKLWEKNYGGSDKDMITKVNETPDGVLLLGGLSKSPVSGNKTVNTNGKNDFWFIKANSSGDMIWEASYGGLGDDDLYDAHPTNDGGYILGGISNSTASGDFSETNQGTNDAWVVKLECDIHIEPLPEEDICEGESVIFDVTDECCFNCTYLWNDGNTSAVRAVTPSTSTIYEVTVTNSFGCTVADTTTINVESYPTLDFGASAFDLCPGDTITLDAENPGSSYLWSTGANSQTIEVATGGVYTVTVTNGNQCSITASANVNLYTNPMVDLGPDEILCEGSSTVISADNPGSDYSWSTGDNSQTITVDTSGEYFVTVTNIGGCSALDSVTITFNEAPSGSLSQDTSICNGESVPITFNLSGNGPFDVLYTIDGLSQTLNNISDGHTIQVNPASTSIYSLNSVTDSNVPSCTATANQSVTVTVFDPITINIDEQICAGDSLFLQGAFQSITGIYYDTLSTYQGCDSIIVTDLYVASNHNVFIPATSCNPLDTGNVSTLYINQYGCDSLVTVTTSLLASDTTYLTTESCNPLDTGLVIYNLTNQSNCDSVVYETTILLSSDTTYLTAESCNPLDTGLVIYNLTNQNNCDSVVYETTILLSSDTTYLTAESCNPLDTGLVIYNLTNQNNCDSVVYETTILLSSDTTYLTAESCNPLDTGLVIYNLTNQNNCDSVVYETTVLLASDTTYLFSTTCNPLDTGITLDTYTAENGCDSLVIEQTDLLLLDTTHIMSSSCDPLAAGQDTLTLLSSLGCDSVVITTTTYLLSDTTYLFSTTCNPLDTGITVDTYIAENGCDSLVIEQTDLVLLDTTYIMSSSCDPLVAGQDTLTLLSSLGCDSVVITTTTYLLSDTTYLFSTTCNPLDTGITVDTYTSENGCDSLVIEQTDLVLLDTTYIMSSSCDPLVAGQDTLTLLSSLGCDSVVIRTTTYLFSDTTYLFSTTCNPLDTGITVDTYTSENGCDSLVIEQTDLVLLDTTYIMSSTCDPLVAGQDTLTLLSSSGCDSVVITTTTYLLSDTTYLFSTTCNPLDTGITVDTYTSENGCDSLVIQQTELIPLDTTYIMSSTCDPLVAGQDTLTLQSSSGCDSVVITTTTYLLSDTTYLFSTTCNPLDTGITVDTYTSENGCDSLVIEQTDLVLLDTTYIISSSCDPLVAGQDTMLLSSLGCDSVVITTTTYLLSDTTYLFSTTCNPLDTGITVDTYIAENGCDSLVIEQTDLVLLDTTYILSSTCDPLVAGQDTLTLQSSLGCDSVVITTTTYLLSDTTYLFSTTCNPLDTGITMDAYTSENGCDSLVIQQTDLVLLDTTYIMSSTCDPLAAGQDTMTLLSSLGCDSVVITTTSYLFSDTIYLFSTTCNPLDTGITMDTYAATNGCDSLVIEQTDLALLDTTYIMLSSCDQSEIGQRIDIFTSSLGCDSVVIMTTNYLASDTTYLFETTCNAQDTGLQVINLNNQFGCDSIVNLQIDLLPSDTFNFFLTSCNVQDTGTVINIYINQFDCDSVEIIRTDLLARDTTWLWTSSCDQSATGIDTSFYNNQYGCDSLVILSTSLSPTDTLRFTSLTCEPDDVRSDTLWLTNQEGCDSLIIDDVVLREIDFGVSIEDVSCYNESDGKIKIDTIRGAVGEMLYAINDGLFSESNEFILLPAGDYQLYVMDDEGCTATKEYSIKQPDEFILDLGNNQELALGDSVALEPYTNLPVASFYWASNYNFDCDTCWQQMVRPMRSMSFSLTAISETGCEVTEQLRIMVRKERPVFVPNVFSPDNDGVNDVFRVFADDSVSEVKAFRIFNRWGALLHEERNVQLNLLQGWNGYSKGRALDSGVFIYYLEIEFIDGWREVFKGDFTLVK